MFKKLFSLALAVVMVMGLGTTAFASEPTIPDEPSVVFEEITDLNDVDLSKPYSETYHSTDSNGEETTIKLSYTPNIPKISLMGSGTYTASAGTWTCYANMPGRSHSYKFDLQKSGTQWKISNARSHSYQGVFCTFSDPSLVISRSVSTSSFAAEINGSVYCEMFDNQWVSIGAGTWILDTTVSSSGVLKVKWN